MSYPVVTLVAIPHFTNLWTLGKEECGGPAWVMLHGSGMQAFGLAQAMSSSTY
jgi:hypothetical protein